MLTALKLLLPALIPSWRFFDTIAPSPRIELAFLKTKKAPSENAWQEFRPRPCRLSICQMLKRMFWNPQWNETLFLVSCAERMIDEPTDHAQREILRRIKADIETGNLSPNDKFLQFRIVFIDKNEGALQKHVYFTSPPHALSKGETP